MSRIRFLSKRECGQIGAKRMKLMKSVLLVTVAVAMILPSIALANISTFSWTYGGGTDAVSGSGSLSAIQLSTGLYQITNLSGTIKDWNGIWSVNLVPANNPNPLGNSTLQNPPGSGGANYDYNDLLYWPIAPGTPATSGSQLDYLGIMLVTKGPLPIPVAESYFQVWSSGGSGNPLPDNFSIPLTQQNVDLTNPFVATLTPEPSLYATLTIGMIGLALFVSRRRGSHRA
jgi:hypothetical protein